MSLQRIIKDVTQRLPARHRNTHRKDLIRHLLDTRFNGQAVILDELRWNVRIEEISSQFTREFMIARSWRNSFNRTIREQFPGYRIAKISINGSTPVGIVARTALYRLDDYAKLNQFFRGEDPCILCRYQTDVEMENAKYYLRYATPQRHIATFRFFAKPPKGLSYESIEGYPGTLIPCTQRQKVSVVVPPKVEIDLQSLAHVPWRLFKYEDDLSDWQEVPTMDSLGSVTRNRRFSSSKYA